MTIQTKAPDIRFENFSGDWQDKGIGSILAETRRPVELLDNELYQLVTVKRRNEGVVARASLKGKDILVKNYFGIKSGDYLISKRQVVHGANGIVPESLDNAVVSNEYLVVTDSDEITAKFWTVISKRHQMHKLFFISSYGVDIEKLVFDVTDWKSRVITIPDVTEQSAITDYFRQLDSLINQHQQKHDKLSNIKKAMLEKMFPKPGKTIPEVRFKGFSGEWEEKELGSVAQITMGQSPSGENYTNNPNDFILVQGNADLKNGFVVPRVWTSEVTKKAVKGALIFSVRAPVGEVGKTNYDVVLGRGVAAVYGNEFIYQQLKKLKSDNYWHKVSAGSTFDAISSTELASTLIWISSEPEQEKIGNYFQKLDVLINQHQQQIIKLTNIKQACLSKMFV
ncbi:restriction modification system, specificity subunit [Vibrio cholerae]|uniref:restriction endonuclease subunit S n=1 Tax=Vibrio cholerae TaxID=666 RepID=UPI0018EF1DAB|nr:restriction endonuclease subunit S [Vibrio cholerae]EKF9136612.1 restriction endonuclease subunit S [Vibrio cholerae]GIA35929.1 restriction modification system, specificity subunit [Vibrio cholerae]